MDRRGVHAGCLHRCDAAVGDWTQAHRSAPASALSASPVATERSAVGTLPACGAPRGPVALRSRCPDVACLCGRRRKAEELGDNGFGGAQHRGDQRRQVEFALAGGAHDAGQDLTAPADAVPHRAVVLCGTYHSSSAPVRVRLPDLFDEPLDATFDREHASSDGGADLLKSAERVYGLVKAFARCLADKRPPRKIRHTLTNLIGQRVFGIACVMPLVMMPTSWPTSHPQAAARAGPVFGRVD